MVRLGLKSRTRSYKNIFSILIGWLRSHDFDWPIRRPKFERSVTLCWKYFYWIGSWIKNASSTRQVWKNHFFDNLTSLTYVTSRLNPELCFRNPFVGKSHELSCIWCVKNTFQIMFFLYVGFRQIGVALDWFPLTVATSHLNVKTRFATKELGPRCWVSRVKHPTDLTDSRCLDCQSQHCSVGSSRTVSSSIGPCHSCHRRTWWPWSRSSRKRLKYSYYNVEQLLTSKSSRAFRIFCTQLNEFRHWINVIISASLWDGGLRGKVFDNGSQDSGFLSPLSIYIICQIELKILTMLGGK